MQEPDRKPHAIALLKRLDAIAQALAQREGSLALIGLGSVGLETERIDAWSDLDFFVIVAPGFKARYIDRLDWLAEAHPLVWNLQNTVDGHKALMADGVLCEFAVFEAPELARIPFAPGRMVWRREGVPEQLAQPLLATPPGQLPDEAWVVGEALSCLLVGLGRWHRGEKLSAARFVQGHAVDRLLELDALRQTPAPGDPFNRERRLEQRQPSLTEELPELLAGYAQTPAAAMAMLRALRRRGAVLNPALVARIEALAMGPDDLAQR